MVIFERWEGKLRGKKRIEHTLVNTLDDADLLAALNWRDAERVLRFIVTDPTGYVSEVVGRLWQPYVAFAIASPTPTGEWTFAVEFTEGEKGKPEPYNIWARFK